MKFWKHTLITAFAFLGISTTVFYTSCVKDACADLKCQNNASCTDGFCNCPTGYEGTECELLSSDRFVGTYYGVSVISTIPLDVYPTIFDTVVIFTTADANKVGVIRKNVLMTGNVKDTMYGYINGRSILIDSLTKNNYKRDATVVLTTSELTYRTEEVEVFGDSIFHRTVSFTGPRAYK